MYNLFSNLHLLTVCNDSVLHFALPLSDVKVVFICTNNKNGLIVRRAGELNMPLVYTTKEGLTNFSSLQKTIEDYKVDYFVLAGFLLKLPFEMVNSFPKKIINIHPSLLPKYGGKGMYGNNVHRAVLENKEFESGITIHFINQNYDEGEIILQKKCPISAGETVESLEKKIRALEFEYFPKTIEKIVLQ